MASLSIPGTGAGHNWGREVEAETGLAGVREVQLVPCRVKGQHQPGECNPGGRWRTETRLVSLPNRETLSCREACWARNLLTLSVTRPLVPKQGFPVVS